MIGEAIRIEERATMNSKGEFKGFKLTRLRVEKSKSDLMKDLESEDKLDKWEEAQMLALRAKNPNTGLINKHSVCRKRKSGMQAARDLDCSNVENVEVEPLCNF